MHPKYAQDHSRIMKYKTLCDKEKQKNDRELTQVKKRSKIKVQKVKCITDNHQMNKKEIEERIVTFSIMNEHKL